MLIILHRGTYGVLIYEKETSVFCSNELVSILQHIKHTHTKIKKKTFFACLLNLSHLFALVSHIHQASTKALSAFQNIDLNEASAQWAYNLIRQRQLTNICPQTTVGHLFIL